MHAWLVGTVNIVYVLLRCSDLGIVVVISGQSTGW